jgi:hypothetical protein
LANKFQHQLERMSEGQRDKYRKTQFFAYLAGLVSLFSFWILVPISMLYPSNGKFGNLLALFELAPLGLFIAIGGLAISLAFKAKCRRMREAALYSVKNEKSDQA